MHFLIILFFQESWLYNNGFSTKNVLGLLSEFHYAMVVDVVITVDCNAEQTENLQRAH